MARLTTSLIVLASLAVPLAFDVESVRPFVGPKLVVVLALGALAPAAVAIVGLARVPRAATVGLCAHAAALAIATALSLVPAVSLAGDYYRGMGLVTRLAAIALALVAARVVVADRSRVVVILRAVLVACALVAVYGIAQVLGLDPIFERAELEQISRAGVTELRIVSTLGHANFVGHLLLFGTGAAVALAGVEARRAARVAAALGGVLVAVGVVASSSRGAWVGLGVQAVALVCLAPAAFGRLAITRRSVAVAVIASLAAASLAVAVARGPVGEQVALRALAFRSDGMTGSGRTLLWRDALPMIGRYAPHGSGPETFVLAFLPYQSAELERAEPYALYDSTHNVLLDAAIAGGVLGLATLVGLLAVAAVALAGAFRRSARGASRALPLGLGVGLVGYVVGGMFAFDTIATAVYLYLFVALAAATGAAPSDEEERRVPAWRAAVAVALLVAAVAFVWPRLRLVWQSDRQMNVAVERASEGRLTEAIPYGRAAIANAEALGPAPEPRHLLARIYARAGDPARLPTADERALLDAGRAELDAALAHTTTPQLLRAERADISLRFGRADEAMADLREAIRIAPSFWPARARLARVLLEVGEVEEARREAEAALDLNPESVDAKAVLHDASAR